MAIHLTRRIAVTIALLLSQFTLATGVLRAQEPYWPKDAPTAQAFQRIVNDLASPAMEGRGLGTAGLDRARAYIVARFGAMGLRPAFGRGATATFTQPFEVALGVKTEQQLLSITPAGGRQNFQTLEAGIDFNVLGLSADGSFDGEAVFVGYGVESSEHQYNSYAGLGRNGLAGKIAVVFRYEPIDGKNRSRWTRKSAKTFHGWSHAATFVKKATLAARHGAVALLVVNPPSHQPGSALMSTQGSSDSPAKIPVIHIAPKTFQRMMGPAGNSLAAVKRLQRLANRGENSIVNLGRVTGKVALKRPRGVVANVAAGLDGAGSLADEVVIIGAHYDHLGYGDVGAMQAEPALHPGADDNASGTAGLLLVAHALIQRMAAERDPFGATGNWRTILFIAFTAEERGLLGSAHLIKRLEELNLTAGQITAMVNLDMIGRLRHNQLHVLGTGSSDGWKPSLRRANEQIQLKFKSGGTSLGASDHLHFYLQNVPVLHCFTGAHSDYHQPTDTPDKINARGGVRIVRWLEALVSELATQPYRMAFVEDKSIGRHSRFGHGSGGPRLGIIPEYAAVDNTPGCGVAAVLPDTPAERSGLKIGDLIVQWDRQTIANVYDLTQALGVCRPGQKVRLKVRRNGRDVKLTVKLVAR